MGCRQQRPLLQKRVVSSAEGVMGCHQQQEWRQKHASFSARTEEVECRRLGSIRCEEQGYQRWH